MRLVWTICGHISLALGIVGIPLPILPTTPFLLLAAFCYARGSTRAHEWLINHSHLGSYIQNWQKEGSIPRKAKILATLLMALTIGCSLQFFVKPNWLRVLVTLPAIGVLAFIWTRPDGKK